MNTLKFEYVPLTFITTEDEFRNTVRNTIIMKYVYESFKDNKSLAELKVETKYGYTDSAKDEGNYKFLRITDIKDGQVNWDTVPYCNCDDESYLLKSDDVLVARTGGTTGKSFLIKELLNKSIFASYLIKLRVSEELNPDFLYLFLNSYLYWNQISEKKVGSAQPNVNAEKLKELMIPYCNLENQNKIVDSCTNFTNEIDMSLLKLREKINLTFNKLKLIDELKLIHRKQANLSIHLRQSILKDAVQGKLVPQDPNDEPASELLNKIWAEKERLIQEGKIKREKPLPGIKRKRFRMSYRKVGSGLGLEKLHQLPQTL